MSSLADRLGLGSTSGPSRPSSAGRGGRPTGPARTSSSGGRASPRGQQRSAPYVKSPTPVASTSANAGNVEGKWEHDLFGAQSDSLAPQLNTSFGKAKRSTSGGVFSKALDGISSTLLNARAATRSPPVANSSNGLFGRLGVDSPSAPANANASNGAFAPATVEANAREREERLRQKAQWEAEVRERDVQRDEQKRLARLQDKDRESREMEEQRRREELLRQEALDLQVARRQTEEQEQQMRLKSSQATLVVIQNLLDGTTPEDVKAALGDFGEILTCQVLESNGDTVSMQLEFMNRGDAERAVKQLDGALADGKTLRLSIKERPKAPPVNNRQMGIPLKGTKSRQQQNGPLARRADAPAPTPQHQEPATSPNMQSNIPDSSSRLRSDRIALYDERATVIDRPQVQRFAKTNQQKQSRPFGAPPQGNTVNNGDVASIAQRFGLKPTQQRFQQQPRGNDSYNQNRPKQDASGLLGRLGGASRRDDDMMDTS